MSLKLIREAALVANLSEAEIKALSAIKTATGASSLLDVVSESFTPSSDDFDAWMRVVVGEAGDRGINLNKKSEFMQLAMDVLENDPAMPPFDMQEMIATKLWQDYQSAKNAVRINKMAQAKEEEEKVATARKRIADRFAQGPVTRTTTNPSAYDEEEMGISDDLAARKIFNKIKGTPNLNFAVVQQYVNKYIGMVGKSPTDVKYISALVYSMAQDAEMAVEDEEVEDFLRRGNQIQQIPARKPRKSERLQGSAHIGKSGERVGRSTTGRAANTMGRPVIGLSKAGTEEEESGFEQAFNAAKGIEDEESSTSDDARMRGYRDYHSHRGNPYDPGTKEYHDWYLGRSEAEHERHGYEDEEPSFVRDALRDKPATSMKGSFSSHLRGEDEFDDEDSDTEVSFGPDGVEGVSDDEVFTSSDDECECPCADDADSELDGEDLPADDEFADDEMGPPEDELDDETMDDVDADVEPRVVKKGFDEEEAVKSFFRQAVTSPNDMMRQAVKDIESEGKSAWAKANVPSNPHPKKSQAYRAWQKGLTNAAKEALGIADKPADPKAKPKRKK